MPWWLSIGASLRLCPKLKVAGTLRRAVALGEWA
jgi:hypothetical protein